MSQTIRLGDQIARGEIKALRELSQEDRLRLLISGMAETSGSKEDDDGSAFRRRTSGRRKRRTIELPGGCRRLKAGGVKLSFKPLRRAHDRCGGASPLRSANNYRRCKTSRKGSAGRAAIVPAQLPLLM